MNRAIIVIGNNHHNTLGLVRSLGRGGYDVLCFLVDGSVTSSFLEKSRYIKVFKLFHSLDELLFFLKSDLKIGTLIPTFTTSDILAEFLDSHYDELCDKLRLCNCGGRQGGISYWMAKEHQLQTAQKVGLTIPNSTYFKINEKCKQIKEIHYPCILKPGKSSVASKDNVRICSNENQLNIALEEVSPYCEDVIVQDYIQREYEFLIMGVRSRKQGLILLPGGLHKLRTCKKTKSLGMFAYAYTTPELDNSINIEAIKRFLAEIDYEGVFSVEFMISKGTAYFLEINLRNDGTQFCFEGAGVNLPQIWAMASLDEDISHLNTKLEKKYCMVEANYVKNMDWHHPLVAIGEFVNTSLFALFDKKDWKPALYKLKYGLSNKKIIVLGGVNHHNTLSMVRCLGMAGYHVELICKGTDRGCAAKSKYVKRTFVYKNETDLLTLLLNTYDDISDNYVLISCDDESVQLLDKYFEELKDKFYFFNAGKTGRLTFYQNKFEQVNVAKTARCMVPKSMIYNGVGQFEFDTYPCLAKPLESNKGGKKLLILHNQQEINNQLKKFSNGNKVLVQQVIDKDYEIVVLGISVLGTIYIPGYVKKIRDNKGGTTYSEIFPIVELEKNVIESSRQLIKSFCYEGLFGVEYIKNRNGYYFIEANLRNDATSYALAIAGTNLAKIYIEGVTGCNISRIVNKNKVEHIFSMVELKDFKFVLKRKIHLKEWLRQLKFSDCRYYYSKEDKKPFFYAILNVVSRVVS